MKGKERIESIVYIWPFIGYLLGRALSVQHYGKYANTYTNRKFGLIGALVCTS